MRPGGLRLRNIPFRRRLFIANTITAFVPLFVLFLVLYGYLYRNLREQNEYAARQALGQAKSFLDYRTETAVALSDTFALSQTVRKIVSRDLHYYINSPDIQQADAEELTALADMLQYSRQVDRVRFYLPDALQYTRDNRIFSGIGTIEETAWYQSLLDSDLHYQWFTADEIGGSQRMVGVARALRASYRYEQYVGALRIDISEEWIENILRQAQLTPRTILLLVNGRGMPVVGGDLPGEQLEALSAFARDNSALPVRWAYETFTGQRYLAGAARIEQTDWKLCVAIPESDILAPGRSLMPLFMLVGIGCVGVAAALAYLFSRNNSLRVTRLLEDMARMESGEIAPTRPERFEGDEIGVLTYRFYAMRGELATLIEERQRAAERLKESEMRALQEQINPHFLYNTLDFMHWTALEQNAGELARMVIALSRFYRLSLGRGYNIVTLAQEIRHIEAYMQIQDMRFKSRIAFTVDVEAELMGLKMPRITLQPMVENAIYHGIFPRENRSGRIAVRGKKTQGGFDLWIEDDGVGMDARALEGLFNVPQVRAQDEIGGYGLHNVRERLMMLYPEGLTIEAFSEPGKGTRIVLRFEERLVVGDGEA